MKRLFWILRHLIAIAILPFAVTVVIPIWLAKRYGIKFGIGSGGVQLFEQFLGVLVLVLGLILFFASLINFITVGRGTLAPWDPPRNLVVRGPYRYVRNPMISSVIFILFGEGLVLLSRPHLEWAVLFLIINLIYIPLFEEPMLVQRFGESYREYCRYVPRVIPRWRPWKPPVV